MKEELKRDPGIEAALRGLEGEPPFESVRWDRLHRAIMSRTGREIESARRSLNWFDYTARWARAAIPLAMAAIVAIILLLPGGSADQEPETLTATVSGREALTMAMAGDVREQEFVRTVVGSADREWLVTRVMGVE